MINTIDASVRLRAARDTVRRLQGDSYDAAILPHVAMLEALAVARGVSVLSIATEVATMLEDEGMPGPALVIMAAALESIERAP